MSFFDRSQKTKKRKTKKMTAKKKTTMRMKMTTTKTATQSVEENTTLSEEFERWKEWAQAQANRIDPAQGRAFLDAIRDEDDGKT
jgi:hypothetical protein